jgi:hypothetical protein
MIYQENRYALIDVAHFDAVGKAGVGVRDIALGPPDSEFLVRLPVEADKGFR